MKKSQTKKIIAPPWEDIEAVLGSEVVSHLAPVVANQLPTGPRLFFSWVAKSSNPSAVMLKSFYMSQREDFDSPKSSQLVIEAVNAWTKQSVESGNWKPASFRGYHRTVVPVMIELGDLPDGKFPKVFSRNFKYPYADASTPHPSLGEFDWPEYANSETADRDLIGLRLIREHALRIFEYHESIFLFGQSVMQQNHPPQGAEREWLSFKALMDLDTDSRNTRNLSMFFATWTPEVKRLVSVLTTREAWRKLGFDIEMDGDFVPPPKVAELVAGGIGPSSRLTKAAQAIFCCDTGWNKKPIQRLPVNPFLYRTNDAVKIASQQMLLAFKKRAGHHIMAQLENGAAVRGIFETSLNSVWDETVQAEKFSVNDDHGSIQLDSEILGIIERYQFITRTVRHWCGTDTEDLFFISLSKGIKGNVVPEEYAIGQEMPEGPISRKLVSFSVVRQTFLNLAAKGGASTVELQAIAGQYSSAIIQRHYRGGPEAVGAHKEGIRFFQNCLQALMVDGKLALHLNISADEFAWFRRLAKYSGIEAACGMSAANDNHEVNPDFKFTPTADNLLNLFLAHRALRQRRKTAPVEIWQMQGIPLLGLVTAIGQSLIENGLGTAYRRAARNGLRLLKAGEITLPAVLEI